MKAVLWVLTVIMLLNFVSAENYYADITFDVSDNGNVIIGGTTNSPLFKARATEEFTSKNGKYWLLNITDNHIYSDYVFTINLPDGAIINYAKGDSVRIGIDKNHPFIKGTGKNEKFTILTQYSIEQQQQDNTLLYSIGGFAVLALIAGGLFLMTRKKPKVQRPPTHETLGTETSDAWYDKETLMDRQKDIVEYMEKKGRVTQKELEDELKIPKSSLSRNIDSLVKRGIIIKEEMGMTNVLKISPKKPEI